MKALFKASLNGRVSVPPEKRLLINAPMYALIISIVLFVVGASMLLNDLCIYTPDSAQYLSLASSMAQEMGYRDIFLPGDPVHVKYPPLYPLLLVPAARLCPQGIIVAGKIVTIGIGVCALVVFWFLSGRVFPARRSALIVALTALNPLFIQNAAEVMSESAYILFSALALLLLLKSKEKDGATMALWAGALAGLTILTRFAGVSVLAAGAVFLILSRSWRKGLGFCGLAIAVAAPWVARDLFHIFLQRGTWPPWGYEESLFFFLSSGNSIPVEILQRITTGIAYYATAGSHLLWPFLYPNESLLRNSISPLFLNLWRIPSAVQGAAMLLAGALALAGVYCCAKDRRKRVFVIYAVIGLGIPILYPTRDLRLIVPLLPFLWGILLEGAAAVAAKCRSLARLAAWSGSRAFLLSVAVVYFLACLAVGGCLALTNLAFCGVIPVAIPEASRFFYDLSPVAAWLREKSAPEDVVLCDRSELYFLSGRKVVGAGQYASVFGGFEWALRKYNVRYVVSEASAGVSMFHRLMANALLFDFEKVADFSHLNIFKVAPREKPRAPYAEQYAQPIRILLQEARENPRDPEVHKKLGYFYFKAKLLDRAAEEFRQALSLDPTCQVTWFNLGSAELDSGKYDEAITAFEHALKGRGADMIVPLVKPSIRLAVLGREIRENPGDPMNFGRYMEAGLIYFNMKEFSKSIEQLLLASALQPASSEPWFCRGLCHERLGEKAAAMHAYRKALKLNPGEEQARQKLAELAP